MNRLASAALLVVGSALLAQGARSAAEEPPAPATATAFSGVKEAVAVLRPTQGHQASGTIVLRPHAQGVELEVALEGLPKGSGKRHGFHVHEFGDCSAADAASAGPHYDPTGMMSGQHRHGMKPLGDLDDLVADAEGRVKVRFVARDLSLVGEKPILGRGLLLHESYDDPSDPLLAAGARIACGVIGVRQPGGPAATPKR